MSKAIAVKKVEETFDAAKQAAVAEINRVDAPVDNGKMAMKNKAGEMLTCKLTIQKRVGAPDPLCVTINEEFRWIKRGLECIVPWYLILHLRNNIERRFTQGTDETGKKIVIVEDAQAEPFTYRPIDPAEDNPNWLD